MRKAAASKLVRQDHLVDDLKQTRSQLSMNLHCGVDDQCANFIFPRLCLPWRLRVLGESNSGSGDLRTLPLLQCGYERPRQVPAAGTSGVECGVVDRDLDADCAP